MKPPGAPAAARHPLPRPIFLLLGAAVLLAFLRTLQCGFLEYDDNLYVVRNTEVQQGLSWGGLAWAFRTMTAGNWHPLTWLSHMLDWQMFGANPWGHHLTSVLLHTANVLLLFAVLWRLTGADVPSLFVAGIFGLHPLRVESVAWIAERKDVLSVFFFMLTLLAYTGYVEQRERRRNQAIGYYLVLFGSLCLGLLCKSMLVTVPAVLLLLDYWPLGRWQPGRVRGLVLEKLPLLIPCLLVSLVTFIAQRQRGAMDWMTAGHLPFGFRVETALVAYVRYLFKFFCPVGLSFFYPYPDHWPVVVVLGSALLLAGITFLVVRGRRAHPYLLTGWFWFVGTLVPVVGLVQVGRQSLADRYLYVPSIGIAIALAWGVQEWTREWRRRFEILVLASLAAVLACAALTYRQIGFWKDNETLFRHANAVTRDNYVALHGIGTVLLRKGQPEAAVDWIQQAVSIMPDDADSWSDLGVALGATGKLEEAQRALETSLKLNPANVEAENNLAIVLAKEGHDDEAILHYQKALKLSPQHPDFHHDLGMLLVKKGRTGEGIEEIQEAIRLQPKDANLHFDLAIAYTRNNQLPESETEFREALRLDPRRLEAHGNLGAVLARTGRPQEAILEYQAALKLNPSLPELHHNLGLALLAISQTNEAIAQFQEALRLNPNFTVSQKQLEALSGK